MRVEEGKAVKTAVQYSGVWSEVEVSVPLLFLAHNTLTLSFLFSSSLPLFPPTPASMNA